VKRLTFEELPDFCKVEEAAAYLGVSRCLLYEHLHERDCPVKHVRIGQRILIPKAVLGRLRDGQDPTGATP
jgi:excisionase family DNA binding protein